MAKLRNRFEVGLYTEFQEKLYISVYNSSTFSPRKIIQKIEIIAKYEPP